VDEGRTIIRVMEDNFMTSYSVGLRHKTRAKAITIERLDASLDRGPFCLHGFARSIACGASFERKNSFKPPMIRASPRSGKAPPMSPSCRKTGGYRPRSVRPAIAIRAGRSMISA
jgi:hypothetical protein